MLKTWKSIFALFTKRERNRFILLLVSASLIAILDVIGVASVLPFIAVAINPNIIESNEYLQLAYETLNFSSEQNFLIFLGFFAFVALLISNGLSMLDAWYSLRFWYTHEYRLSTRLLRTYLDQPYLFQLQRNSAELGRIVLSEVDRAVSNVLMHSVDVLASMLAALLLTILLVIINPLVAAVTLAVLGLAYSGIYLLLERRMKNLGKEYVKEEAHMYRRTREALEGAKEVKLHGRELEFTQRYAEPKYRATRNCIQFDLLSLFPERILETLAFGGIVLLVIYLTSTSYGSADSSQALSLVALYTFAAYRMMPALKAVFDGIEKLTYHAAALQNVLHDLTGIQAIPLDTAVRPIILNEAIELTAVSFRYPGATEYAVNKLSAQIPAGETTCIAGASGAGKSTTMDLLLGLLEPEQGNISIDGIALSPGSIRTWQQRIGYAANVSFLTDDSITENIAFGLLASEIDFDRVKRVSSIVGVNEFVHRELPLGYNTRVGEQGSNLSAGQRQRIGLARALYHDPDLLLLDEATNSLDANSEREIMDALFQMKPSKTIVIISHREWVTKLCDNVLVFSSGSIIPN